MNESSPFRYALLQHPLYHAIEKCIDREVTDTYNYRDFFSSWNKPMVDNKLLMHELFRVDEIKLDVYIEEGNPAAEYLDFLTFMRHGDQEVSKKLLRFLLALPVCEYEIVSNNNTTSKSTESENRFSKSLSPFKYDQKYTTIIEDREIASTIHHILESTNRKNITNGVAGFAFNDFELVQKEDELENDYTLNFKEHLVQPICSFLQKALRLGVKVKHDFKSKTFPNDVTFRVLSDLHLIRNRQVFCIIEMKMFPIPPTYVGQNTSTIGVDTFNKGNIHKFMKQLITQMVYFKTNVGIVSDSYIVIFVEIDLDCFERNVNTFKSKLDFLKEKTVPLKYKILDCHSAAPTLREGLMHFFYTAILDEEKDDIRRKRMLKLREYLWATPEQNEEQLDSSEYNTERSEGSFGSRPSTAGTSSTAATADTQSSTTLASINEENEELPEEHILEFTADDNVLMQNGDIYNSQLVKVDARCMKKYLLDHVGDSEKLVAKFYDPRMAKDEDSNYKYSKKALLKLCLKAYNNERWIYQTLSTDPKFNSCYIPHKRGYAKVTVDRYYLTKGYFNLFRYVETIALLNDIELYEKAREQLEVIHRHGIIHGDIREDNILCTKDRKVFIIDFAFSVSMNEWNTLKSTESDLSSLKSVFGVDDI